MTALFGQAGKLLFGILAFNKLCNLRFLHAHSEVAELQYTFSRF